LVVDSIIGDVIHKIEHDTSFSFFDTIVSNTLGAGCTSIAAAGVKVGFGRIKEMNDARLSLKSCLIQLLFMKFNQIASQHA